MSGYDLNFSEIAESHADLAPETPEGAVPDAAPLDGAPDPTPTPETPEAPADPAAAAAQAAQAAAEYQFVVGGKEVKVPANDPRVSQWLRQGYDYNQRMEQFKAQQAEIEAKAARAAEFESRYGEVDKYIAQNPDWWAHVQSQYQARAAQDPNSPILKELNQLKEAVGEVKAFKAQAEQREQAEIAAKEDQALDAEIKSLREAYPDIDFASVDASGMPLEKRVLAHAVENGIKSFRAAFRDMNHDQLVKREAEKAKEQLAKDMAAKKKQGFLGKTPVPTKGVTPSNNKDQSYFDAALEGLSELSG